MACAQTGGIRDRLLRRVQDARTIGQLARNGGNVLPADVILHDQTSHTARKVRMHQPTTQEHQHRAQANACARLGARQQPGETHAGKRKSPTDDGSRHRAAAPPHDRPCVGRFGPVRDSLPLTLPPFMPHASPSASTPTRLSPAAGYPRRPRPFPPLLSVV